MDSNFVTTWIGAVAVVAGGIIRLGFTNRRGIHAIYSPVGRTAWTICALSLGFQFGFIAGQRVQGTTVHDIAFGITLSAAAIGFALAFSRYYLPDDH